MPGVICSEAAEKSMPLLKREGISKSCLTNRKGEMLTHKQGSNICKLVMNTLNKFYIQQKNFPISAG